MRISWGRIYPGRWNEFESAFHSVVTTEVEGLIARWMVQATDGPDAVFGITLWSDRKHIDKWLNSDSYKEHFQAALSKYFVGSFSTSVCEVRFASGFGPSMPNGV
jgi:heme-degrading monooxygenase HmoA